MIVKVNNVIQPYMIKMGIKSMSADSAARLLYEAGIIQQHGPAYGFAFREFIRKVRNMFGYDLLFKFLGITQKSNQKRGHYTIHSFNDLTEFEMIKLVEDKIGEKFSNKLSSENILPDYLKNGLDVIFVGTSVGSESARLGKYYSNSTNRFWDLVNESSLVPDWIGAENCHFILEENCGLTDIVKNKISSSDSNLEKGDFDIVGFLEKIKIYKPRFVAFNGKRAFKEVFGYSPSNYGLMSEKIGDSKVFVLPSSSGADTSMTYEQKLLWYKKLKGSL